MLTGDLVRFRINGEFVKPAYITRNTVKKYIYLCCRLVSIYKNHHKKTCGNLEKAIEQLEGEYTNYKIIRGLSKLLMEQCECSPEFDMDYAAFRQKVFTAAQKHYPVLSASDLLHKKTRADVLRELADELCVTPENIEKRLYGDLPENLILSVNITHTPESLLKRYNLALAQGLLYRSQCMKILLKGNYRVVFQYLKLARLMHWITPLEGGGLQIMVNGPASLFSNTQRYGIRMAMFLPGLLLADQWKMTAEIQLEGIKHFVLDQDCGLDTHYQGLPPFDSKIEEHFYDKFNRKDRKWQIERETEIIDLGGSLFIPDFVFRHPDGRKAYMEVIGFWTAEYLRKKIEKISRAGRKNLILAVNSHLNCKRDDFNGEVIFYTTGIKIRDVLEKIEKTACKK